MHAVTDVTGPTDAEPRDERAVWLLDVDGVLNGARPGWSAPPRTSRAFADGHAHRMRWAPALTATIGGLHTSGAVEVRWATTWIDHQPDQISRLMSLPRFACAYPADPARAAADDYPARHTAAKLSAALTLVRARRRLIWTDDEAIPTDGPARTELDAAGALLIAPDERRGLRPEHLDTIRDYLDPHRTDYAASSDSTTTIPGQTGLSD